MFGYAHSEADTEASSNQGLRSKEYWRTHKKSGLYQSFDPVTLKLQEEGRFANGE